MAMIQQAALKIADPAPVAATAAPFVDVRNLEVRIDTPDAKVPLLNGVSFSLRAGEVLCLLGESGSGKSMTVRSLMRLLPEGARISGKVEVGGVDVLALKERQLRTIRGPLISMIFQEPATAFDPTFTIGYQIAETVRLHEGVSRAAARKRALDLLELVQVPSAARRLDAYPHELSGGLRQRAMIALALSCRPKLLIADEPTTALDATVQIQVLLLLRELQSELGMATIFVTHDIGVACEIADRIAVMYAGRFVEEGPIDRIIAAPQHPYTIGLLHSVVTAEAAGTRLESIPGAPPSPAQLPAGCSFNPRCFAAVPACAQQLPDLREAADDHFVRCIRAPLAPEERGLRK